MVKYTLYIDESGDTGIENVRENVASKGASPFLVFGACLVPEVREKELIALHEKIRVDLGCKSLHCSELSHLQIAKFSRMVAEKAGIKCFAFVSRKATLREYKTRIEGRGQDQKYYNKCVSYLLERVGHWMKLHSVAPEDLRIVFENRAKHDYEKLRNYLRIVKKKPLEPRLAEYLPFIDPLGITSQEKTENPLLSYADLVAYAVFSSVNSSKANFGIPEQR